ncbi:hypothetical protein MTP41_15505 [Faecalibacterium sp. I4-3-84]|uniref:hypothetical protein n=1 Tax=Faecalibacterium sp. I4-3-84 TaxID=2929495 RepID=UPI0010584FF6|nr:hypothetical protein [Faecalibacterium sp. I4-3-84]UQK37230.1 hypothetical protein MTP41_15505 [Faecalibacterium sp. I4-3-84]
MKKQFRRARRPAGTANLKILFPLILPERKRRQFQIVLFRFKGSKVIPSADAPKMQEAVCTESSDLSIAFLARRGYNQTIDSNGAVGHLLTRSAVFVKMLSYFWVRHCGRPECRRKGKKNKIK